MRSLFYVQECLGYPELFRSLVCTSHMSYGLFVACREYFCFDTILGEVVLTVCNLGRLMCCIYLYLTVVLSRNVVSKHCLNHKINNNNNCVNDGMDQSHIYIIVSMVDITIFSNFPLRN